MTAAALCVAVLFSSLAVGHLAHAEEKTTLTSQEGSASAIQAARKLLSTSPMMMGMSTSPMMMSMSPMMMPMAPTMAPMMYMLTLTPNMEVPAVSYQLHQCLLECLTFLPIDVRY